jgi:quercetin dioxygenase-like cupin family protein
MSESQSKLSEVIDIHPAGPAPTGGPSRLLAKAETLEVRLLTLTKGREIPPHHARGEITVHCLEGRIAFTAEGKTRELGPGQMLILAAGEPHSLVGLEDAAVLVTKVLPTDLSTP